MIDHVASCPACRARLEEARDEAAFLERVRALRGAELGPEGAPRLSGYRVMGTLSAAARRSCMLQALRKDKSQRYASAAALGQDLQRFLAALPVEARAGSGWYLLRNAVSANRARLLWAGIGALIVAGAASAVVLSVAGASAAARREAVQREEARREGIRLRAVTELLRDALPATDSPHPETGSALSAGLGRLYLRLESGAFAGEPELDQEIRRLWGRVYTGLEGRKAAELVEYAEVSLRSGLVRLRERSPTGDDPRIAAALHELAGVLLVRGRLPEAERLAAEALSLRARLLGPAHASTGETIALHARILMARGRIGPAERRAEAAIAILGPLPGAHAALTGASMVALKARAALDAGTPDRAEPWVREALACRLAHLPPDAEEVLESLAALGDLAVQAPDCALSRLAAEAWQSPSGSVARALGDDVAILRTALGAGRAAALGRIVRLAEALLGPDHVENSVFVVFVRSSRPPGSRGRSGRSVRLGASGRNLAGEHKKRKHRGGMPAVAAYSDLMARTTVFFGVVLILLGLGAYGYALTTEQASPTALIPAFAGVPILGLGLAAGRWPGKRALLVHVAVLLAVLGLLGAGRGLISLPKLISDPDSVARPVAAIVQSIMALLCLAYVVLAVRSFVAARRGPG